ncbi:tetratricopeptide repeat protein [Nocardioides sp. AX2bis]|uniref:tetratricopeptide repeat protein n=1 Tax=Nocardioides sp. AX2bis TaxID=2653157 RepID=UPI0012EF9E46|nr:tetratricopeptide repeat protein [Nocardioides sp. AX2bis]VXB60222.1 conserved hypothetical protein [Nocardioides sp. AX2bis]
MTEAWDVRVAEVWSSADEFSAKALLAAIRDLADERGEGDPSALFELASAYDFVGRETDAVPLYRAALDAGVAGSREPQAVIQLASSLRNTGNAEEAVDLLTDLPGDPVNGPATDAFLALALRDCGRPDEALRVALRALAPLCNTYERAVNQYADELL